MAPVPSPRAASGRRSRTSIAHPISAEHSADKENQTIHGTTAENGPRKSSKRALRSQSLGPGGIEALGEGTGNRQKVQPLPRSILKPTIPLSPPKNIPQHPSQSGRSPARKPVTASPRRGGAGTAVTSHAEAQSSSSNVENASSEAQQGDTGTKIDLKSEEQQQAAARERERLEVQQRREERRKSLANRRVSFAPEATLHTWDVVELPEDATSSSEATNSTRRSTLPASPYPDHTRDRDTPSSPTAAGGDDVQVAASPASLSDAKRKNSRRSSAGATESHDLSSSPVSSTGSDDTHQSFVTGEDDIVDESDTDEDRDLEAEETITSVDNDDDATGNTTALTDTASLGIDSSDALDRALREATRLAIMQRTTMEEPEADETHANDRNTPSLPAQPEAQSEITHQEADVQDSSEDEEMTMDVTQSFGAILPPSSTNRSPLRQEKRNSLSTRRRSSHGHAASNEDETMEFTTAIGGIKTTPSKNAVKNVQNVPDDNEEMTMEFTTMVGGVVTSADSERVDNVLGGDDDESLLGDNDMDMTIARGTILSPVTERTEPSENGTMGMDFTAVVGSILPDSLHSATKTQAKLLMEEEADHGQLTRSPSAAAQERLSAAHAGSDQSFSQKGTPTKPNRVTQSPAKQSTPLRKLATPTKQLTPKPGRPTTPSKTPPPKNVSMRNTSPKRLFKESKPGAAARQSKSPKSAPPKAVSTQKQPASLTPPMVLTPKSRRSSGVGIDQLGIGSPKVAAKLDRRSSIGEQAAAFKSRGISTGVVRFQDPRAMAQQLENERAEDARRESGPGVLEREVDAKPTDETENTGSLREIIGGLTPKKNRLNGRKSLATGGAKGLLGKRPRELDEDDEDATPKKLKGKDQSPVKSVFLPAPPSKDETTGRLGKAPVFSLSVGSGSLKTPTTESPPKTTAPSPATEGRFKNTRAFNSAEKPPPSFNEQVHGSATNPVDSAEDEPIHLRDFLNMTSIRFMELTTTKRRHTVVAPAKGSATPIDDTLSGAGTIPDPADDRRLAACVAAGASTIPMLELYQHSCRELKKYISEGRSIVREIEDDTYEDNPPLFREYLTASPQVRSIMDNQFKNVKTHARLLSREMWYEWRMKLLDGLKVGLDRIQKGLTADEADLAAQERILESVMPQLQLDNNALHEQVKSLQNQADELASCDPAELDTARNELVTTEKTIAATLKQIDELEAQVSEKTETVESLGSRKATCLTEITEAERMREEFRGWNATEVVAEKAKVDEIERACGWTIVSAHEGAIELVYRSQIALYLKPSAFKSSQPTKAHQSTISLSYAGEDGGCTTTHRFFLQLLRARLHSMPHKETPIRHILTLVENGWHLASQISSQAKDMSAAWPTQEVILSDDVLQITSSILLRNYRTKIDASFEITMGGTGAEITATIHPHAKSVYGQELKQEKMADVLSNESGLRGAGDNIGSWSNALETLEKKLNRFLAGKEKQ